MLSRTFSLQELALILLLWINCLYGFILELRRSRFNAERDIFKNVGKKTVSRGRTGSVLPKRDFTA